MRRLDDYVAKLARAKVVLDPARRAEMRKLLEERIDALPGAYRAVFMLRAVEEYSVEETAAILQIPEATVRSRFFRARGLLREVVTGGTSRGANLATYELAGKSGTARRVSADGVRIVCSYQ